MQESLASLPEPLRRHLAGVVLPLCGWTDFGNTPEAMPDFGKRRFAFCRRTLRRGGSARVMIEQLAALEPTGARSDVYTFEDGWEPDIEAEIRVRCPSVRTIRRVSRRLASWKTLWLEEVFNRHDLFISTDIQDALIFSANVEKWHVQRPPRVAAVMHEEYDRYLAFLLPHAPRLSAVCLDYDFTARLRPLYGSSLFSGVVAPLFPLREDAVSGGADLRRKLNIPEQGRVLAYAGRLDRNKQIELLAGVLEDLLTTGSDDTWLLLAGRWEEESYRREVSELFRREVVTKNGTRLSLWDRIRELGPVRELGSVFAAADVFVFASHVEGFYPLVVMEAQQAGLPVVCTGVGGLDRVILDGVTGFLAPTRQEPQGAAMLPETRTVFADRVRVLLDDPAARRRMGQAGRQAVRFLTRHYPFARLFRKWVQGALGGEAAR